MDVPSLDCFDFPRRYVSADHAVGIYLRLRTRIEGSPALDYERLSLGIQSAARPENPFLDTLSECWELERVFDRVREKSSARRWACWVTHRVRGVPLADCGEQSKSNAAFFVAAIDGEIEEVLAVKGRLVRGAVRD